VADRGVAALADLGGNHLAGVDPDPGGEVEPVLAAQFGGVLADVVVHLQRRVASPPCVVLVGDGGAEDRHDPVAGELVDRPLEAVHRFGEGGEEALHDRVPLLRILALGHIHRPLDVGEEHRDLLALAAGLRDFIHAAQAYACTYTD